MPDRFSDLNISLNEKIAEQISFFASRHDCSLDDMAKQLIQRGIEDFEDELKIRGGGDEAYGR